MSRSGTAHAAKAQHHWLFGGSRVEPDFQKNPPVAIGTPGHQPIDGRNGALEAYTLPLGATLLLTSSLPRVSNGTGQTQGSPGRLHLGNEQRSPQKLPAEADEGAQVLRPSRQIRKAGVGIVVNAPASSEQVAHIPQRNQRRRFIGCRNTADRRLAGPRLRHLHTRSLVGHRAGTIPEPNGGANSQIPRWTTRDSTHRRAPFWRPGPPTGPAICARNAG